MIIVAEIDGDPIAVEHVVYHLSVNGRLPAVIAEMVGEEAIARGAESFGIRVTDEDLQKAADDFRRQARLLTPDDTKRFFESRGWRPEEFEKHLERGIRRAAVRQRVVPRERVETFLREHRPDFRIFAVSRILVESIAKAQEIADQIKEGEIDFTAAARKFSREALSAVGGGFAGAMRLSDFPPAMRAGVMSAQPGDLIGPVEIQGGAALVKIEAVRDPDLTPPLFEEIAEHLFVDWLNDEVKKLNARMVLPQSAVDQPAAEGKK